MSPVSVFYWAVLWSLRKIYRTAYGLDPLAPLSMSVGFNRIDVLLDLDEAPVWTPDWRVLNEVIAQVVLDDAEIDRMHLEASTVVVSHPLAGRAQEAIDGVYQCYHALTDVFLNEAEASQWEFDGLFDALRAALQELAKYRAIGGTIIPGPTTTAGVGAAVAGAAGAVAVVSERERFVASVSGDNRQTIAGYLFDRLRANVSWSDFPKECWEDVNATTDTTILSALKKLRGELNKPGPGPRYSLSISTANRTARLEKLSGP